MLDAIFPCYSNVSIEFLFQDVGEFAMLRMPSLTFILLTVFLLSSCFLVAVIVPNGMLSFHGVSITAVLPQFSKSAFQISSDNRKTFVRKEDTENS